MIYTGRYYKSIIHNYNHRAFMQWHLRFEHWRYNEHWIYNRPWVETKWLRLHNKYEKVFMLLHMDRDPSNPGVTVAIKHKKTLVKLYCGYQTQKIISQGHS